MFPLRGVGGSPQVGAEQQGLAQLLPIPTLTALSGGQRFVFKELCSFIRIPALL